MARNTMEDWLPEEYDSEVIQRVNQVSGVEAFARRIPMGSDSKNVSRSAGVGVEVVSKGGTYGEDESLNDDVNLAAKKFGKAIRIAEEDLDDAFVDVVAAKQRDWATSYGKMIDNACLGVTAAVGTGVPFESVYRSLSQTDSDLDYTGDANIVQTAGAVTYDKASEALGKLEVGGYFDATTTVVIANTAFREHLRGIKDDQGMPIFIQGLAGTPDTLFGHPVVWSLGAKTSATATSAPTGNAIAVFANADFLLLGVRSGPESIFIDGRSGASALTDEAILKMRARRGFVPGHPKAFSILEVTAA